MLTLSSNFKQAMRFGTTSEKHICKFNGGLSWSGIGETLTTHSEGKTTRNEPGYQINEDFYLTFVYVTYDSNAIVCK